MSAEIDDIKDIGEEEYIIMNLDSRQMETDGTNWFVKNMRGERGFDEPIPYVTSIELVDSYIPNTFYNIEEYNNVFTFGTQLEHYVLNDSENQNTRPVYSINSDNSTLNEVVSTSSDDIPVNFQRKYVKLNPSQSADTLSTFVIRHTIIFQTDGFTLRFTVNQDNTTVPTIGSFLIHLADSNGSEIKKGVLERGGYVDVTVGRRIQNTLGEWVTPPGQFDMFTSEEGLDDIPENIQLKVFSYVRVEYPIQNYTSEQLMETTNEYITSHMRQIFDARRDDIVAHMPYETFLELHLKLEKNDKSKRFTFTSKHNHPFFIDLIEPRSITQELGFSHRFYVSSNNVEIYNQKMGTSDAISSLTVKELRATNSGSTGNNTMLYQAFSRLFFDTSSRPSNVEILSDNLVSLEPLFVNDYPFKKGDNNLLVVFGRVDGTLISYYGVLMLENDYYILPFKESFFNIFCQRTNESNSIRLQSTSASFYKDDYTDILNDKTFVDAFEYRINTQNIVSENIINLSGERYVDLVCVEIQNELKRYNAGYNKLYRYYFDDISDLYVTSTKGNVTDLVLRNPRDFGPVARLNKLTIQFIRSDGNVYDFKTIPFYITVAIKYLKPVLRTEEVVE